MKQVSTITLKELREMSKKMYDELVKADVDIKKGIMVVDGELHADIESLMIAKGSKQNDLWGINLYPKKYGTEEFIEFDSMINIRPSQGNRSRYVEDESTRQTIAEIVNRIVKDE